ncbi:MAG: hypothetical protein IKT52_00695 [Oscillospiraceae bacterium]|nr:hypothetical protein [Oscillospiraceae bacterium]
MKPVELLEAMGDVRDSYVQEAGACRKPANQTYTRRKLRPLIIAAIIGISVLLMGSAIAVMNLQDLIIGERTTGRGEILDADGNILVETELTQDVISLQGIQSTPAYLANQEWLQFTQTYKPEAGEYWESNENYWAYSVLDQTMADKIDEICDKYSLKVIGKPWHEHVDCYQFLPIVGIEDLLKADSTAKLNIPSGRFFEGGSFTVYGTLTLKDQENPLNLTYHCIKKDVFYDVFAYVPRVNVTEKHYTTDENESVLLLYSNKSGLILANHNEYFITISVDLVDGVSLEQVADVFDFTVQGKPIDTDKANEREQLSLNIVAENSTDQNFLRRPTYHEYVNDLLRSNPSDRDYTFYDLDGNGEKELLIIYDGFISNVVCMHDGKTDEGKSYHMKLCEDNVLIDEMEIGGNTYYHIFRFANDGEAVFSNSKEQSIIRLKHEAGVWWCTSDTAHYADYDTQITEDEAKEILNKYIPVQLDTKPLKQFAE